MSVTKATLTAKSKWHLFSHFILRKKNYILNLEQNLKGEYLYQMTTQMEETKFASTDSQTLTNNLTKNALKC